MNWIQFLSWVTGLYLVYYTALFLFDHSRDQRPRAAPTGEITFTEDIQPKKIGHLPDQAAGAPQQDPKPEPAIIASGGVSLKALFNLCREEAIIYTRPVSF